MSRRPRSCRRHRRRQHRLRLDILQRHPRRRYRPRPRSNRRSPASRRHQPRRHRHRHHQGSLRHRCLQRRGPRGRRLRYCPGRLHRPRSPAHLSRWHPALHRHRLTRDCSSSCRCRIRSHRWRCHSLPRHRSHRSLPRPDRAHLGQRFVGSRRWPLERRGNPRAPTTSRGSESRGDRGSPWVSRSRIFDWMVSDAGVSAVRECAHT